MDITNGGPSILGIGMVYRQVIEGPVRFAAVIFDVYKKYRSN